MKITKNVILDMLPLYAADEVSDDTRALVEEYLETDPDLAQVARRLKSMEKPADIPVPRSENGSFQIYRKARLRFIFYSVILASVIALILISIVVCFLTPA